MTKLVGKLAALMLISVLVTSVGATPALADWDKTNYPAIQGSIPVGESLGPRLLFISSNAIFLSYPI